MYEAELKIICVEFRNLQLEVCYKLYHQWVQIFHGNAFSISCISSAGMMDWMDAQHEGMRSSDIFFHGGQPEQAVEQRVGLPVIPDALTLVWRHHAGCFESFSVFNYVNITVTSHKQHGV